MMILEKHQIWFAVAILAAVIILAALGHAYVAALLDKSKADQFHEDMQTQILALRSDLQKQIASIDKDSKIKDPIQIALKVPDYQQGVRPTIVFQRIKRNAKWLAIGAAAGAAIGYAAHH
jgi:hypothetical protein